MAVRALALFISLASLIPIALNGVAFAQSASVTGLVSDAQGRGIPGVTITAIPQSGGVAIRAISGGDGAYRIVGLPEGTYRVDFERPGFEVIRRNHVRVDSRREARIDAALLERPLCECISAGPPSPWAQRVGQVIDTNGHPLPHARINLVGRQAAYADNAGRFLIRLPVEEKWPLSASDTGFRPVTQQESGADAASVVLTLEYVDTAGVPDEERLGGCECDGYLLRYGGR